MITSSADALRDLIEASKNNMKEILEDMIRDAEKKYGKISPSGDQTELQLTIDPHMPDVIQFWFNDSDNSTHLEFYED
jgi:hypothetical protein